MRLWLRIILVCTVVAVLLVAGGYVYLFHLGGLEAIINNRLADLARGFPGLTISLGAVDGDILSGVVVREGLVSYADSTGEHRLLWVDSLSAGYLLSDLTKGRFALDYLRLDGARLQLKRDTAGRWSLPRSLFGGDGDGEAPGFSCRRLECHDGSVSISWGEDTVIVEDLRFEMALDAYAGTVAADIENLAFTSNRRPVDSIAAEGKFTYCDRMLVFSDMVLARAELHVRAEGNLHFTDELSGTITFDADNVDVPAVSALVGKSIAGRLDLNGMVSLEGGALEGSIDMAGDLLAFSFENAHTDFRFQDNYLHLDTLYGVILGDCVIDGSGDVNFDTSPEVYHLEAEIRSFDLNMLVPNSISSDLNGHIVLDGSSFRERTLLMRLQTELFESRLGEFALHTAEGFFFVTTDSISFVEPFTVTYYENEFQAAGCIDYDGEVDLRVDANLANLDRFRGQFFVEEPAGRGYLEAHLAGRTDDPDVTGRFRSDSVWAYDLFSNHMEIEGEVARFLSGRVGWVSLRSCRGSAWGIAYDTISARFAVDSSLVTLDSVYSVSEYASIFGAGLFDYEGTPQLLTLDTLDLHVLERDFAAQGRQIIAIDSAGFDLRRVLMKGKAALVSAEGAVGYDEAMDLRISVKQMPVGPWTKLYDDSVRIDGELSCAVNLSGTFSAPEFVLEGGIDSLAYENTVLGNLVVGVRYGDRRLTIDSCRIRSDPGVYRASGYFHADLAFSGNVLERFPDQPMDIRIKAQDSRFDLVELFMPSVEQLDGEFFADIGLTGTPHQPHLEGQAYIKNGRLKYLELEYPLFTDSAGVVMVDNKIVIERIEAYVRDHKRGGRKRFVYLEGELTANSLTEIQYDVDVSLPKDFPFSYELEDIEGRVEGELHVEGVTPPTVTGDLTVLSMKYMANFGTGEEGSPIMAMLAAESSWDLNINIDILSNYWIKNDDIDGEFAGEVNIVREDGRYRFLGEMEIIRGKGFLFDKTFRLDPEGRVVFEGIEELNPRLDNIVGRTRIVRPTQIVGEEGSQTEAEELCIQISGTLEEPDIGVCPGSPYLREDILPLIVANYAPSDTAGPSGQLTQRLSALLSTQVSQIGGRQLSRLGVETFEIDPYYQGRLDPLHSRVTLGAYALRNLYAYSRLPLSDVSSAEFGLEYRFSRFLMVEGKKDEQGLHHMNLKLHLEF